ncbi:LysR family transcriptional regulator [Pseudomonas tolaasii]|uniref:LysR family transcriptional regulator n=2 Tax=Pseudomonas tolaasii TaxID=29442 RepID=A0A7Y8AL15_PSETO|nr:LysR family transcriptional regulator [Pseudomonas tolaasii]ARB26543.1 LysR family transcriptional regulator [Pseudomonas tolaasii]KAB0477698.1 LysR family transcriptional regulator [Pseudomonas tolaasii]MBY8942744.1 LysR family transcriptional regulator [Pseudomonas tolaasii]NVZ44249.1 LysR family transcriptional regulator [Pseudomonas tolaasii]NWA47110.1 LysR family transcriptional regulator [Pseudomonas tolaasii]
MALNIGWELYRSFLGVLKEGSLSGAARLLGITQPTVGRHIAALETALGVVLFTRSPQGLLPTAVAHTLRAHAETMERTAAALERAASSQGDEVRGVVRISASEVVGVEVLPPIVSQLRRQHPHLKVELTLTNRLSDLLQLEADIAVRMVRPSQEQLLARRIGLIEVGLHARDDYLQQHGIPLHMQDLASHSVIGFDQENAFIRSLAIKGFERSAFALSSDSDLAQLALIRAGAGIGGCQVQLARRNPSLRRVLPQAFALKLDTWVTMHEDLRNSPRCRVTFDALVEGLQHYVQD